MKVVNLHSYLTLVGVAAFALPLLGCDTVEGLGEDIEELGDEIEDEADDARR